MSNKKIFYALGMIFGLSVIPAFDLSCKRDSKAEYGKEIYKRKYDTLAHGFLDLESDFGVKDSHYKTIDDMIDKARIRIKAKSDYKKEDAVEALRTIADIFKENSFETFIGARLLSDAIETGRFDCNVYSAVYLGIAEIINLPLSAVKAPDHVFIRWNLSSGGYFNWETTQEKIFSDEDYIRLKNISKQAINNRSHMANMDRSQMIALHYSDMADVWMDKGNLAKAMENINYAIKLDPNSPEMFNFRGSIFGLTGRLDLAIDNFDNALRLDPNYYLAYANRGNAYESKNDMNNALKDFKNAWQLNPDSPAANLNMGGILMRTGSYNEAVDYFGEAIRLHPGFASAHYNRGIAFKKIGEIDKSNADFEKALELKPSLKESIEKLK